MDGDYRRPMCLCHIRRHVDVLHRGGARSNDRLHGDGGDTRILLRGGGTLLHDDGDVRNVDMFPRRGDGARGDCDGVLLLHAQGCPVPLSILPRWQRFQS